MQRNHIQYAQSKGAPAGFVLPYIVLKNALSRYFYDDLPSASPTDIPINASASLIRVHAVGGGIFLRLGEDVTRDATVQASVLFTMDTNPTHLDTMTIGVGDDAEQEYVFKVAIERAALATLTLSGVITPGKHAESVVTANTIVDGSQITIGTRTYTFKTTLSTGPTVADEILIGGSDAAALDNLKLAINAGAGIGTNYSTGTVVNADVVATDNADTTQKVIARVPGTAANSKATTSLNATLSWPDTTLGGGTGASNPGVASETVTINDKTYSFVDVLSETNGATAIANQVLFGADSAAALDNLKLAVNLGATAGTNYSTGTTAPTDVEATDNTNTTQKFVSSTTGPTGNAYASTETLAAGSFVGATFEDGYLDDGKTILIGVAASNTQTNLKNAINGGAGTPGTDFSTALAKNSLVIIGSFSSDDATITAQAAGEAGNGIEVAETFTASSNIFDDTELTGGESGSNFDAYIPAGEWQDFAPDEDASYMSVIAAGASTDAIVVQY